MNTAPPSSSTAPTSTSSARGQWGIALFGVLVGLAALAWLLQWRIESRPATAADWLAVWPAVTERVQDGDGVYLLPTAAAYDGPRIEELLAKSKQSHDAGFLHAWPPTAADRARWARIWIISPWGDDPSAHWPGAESVAQSGQLGVWLWTRDHSAPAFDAIADLARADVERVFSNGRSAPCRWSRDRHRCTGAWWTSIFPTISEVGDTRRQVLFVQAHPAGATARVTYPNAHLGARLTGGFGLTLAAVRREEGSDTVVRLFVGGEEKLAETVPRGDFGWHTFDIDTSAVAGTATEVRFEVSAEDSAWRQVGIDAVSW